MKTILFLTLSSTLTTINAHCMSPGSTNPIPSNIHQPPPPPLPTKSNHPPYFFDTLLLPATSTPTHPWQHTRRISPQPRTDDALITDFDYIQPLLDPSSPDLRCGRNASRLPRGSKNVPETASVRAGDVVGFAVNTTVGLPIEGAPVNPWDRWPNLYHPGPLTAWLSPPPPGVSLADYDGSGDWIKILSVVNRTSQSLPEDEFYDNYTWKHQWGAYQARKWTFPLPTSLPPGPYLLRIEQIYPLPIPTSDPTSIQPPTAAQFYVNCAHINVVNPSPPSSIKTPTAEYKTRIPGVYTYGQGEIYRWVDVGNETFEIGDFVEPLPRVWEG